ncbi:MAG: argininosuccinate synthase [Sulfurovaceae bacterium]|nr:argininosuccinate synthase [Sulfurovaceae bacterium]MDD5548993.1 argininosuccinate synthase [Sulfurovaceae bacterium]
MRALALFSGGLDSMLAIKTVADMDIEVIALYIKIGFGGTKDISETLQKRALKAGAVGFEIIDVREEYVEKILFNPVYGYGKNFNPCIDCHAFMFRVAKELLPKYNASFIITGEVLGQRPMSQRSDALRLVGKLANDIDEKLILRPMSAKLMEPTTPEIKGCINREKLLDISGRGRDRQLALAKEFEWEDYESPGGGCLLTDPYYSQKIKEHIKFDEFDVDDIEVLKFGRHFRLPDGAKLIIGRNEEDNNSLENIKTTKFIEFKLPIIGPSSLISKNASLKDKELGAKIALTYAKSDNCKYDVTIDNEVFSISPFASRDDARKYFAIQI